MVLEKYSASMCLHGSSFSTVNSVIINIIMFNSDTTVHLTEKNGQTREIKKEKLKEHSSTRYIKNASI